MRTVILMSVVGVVAAFFAGLGSGLLMRVAPPPTPTPACAKADVTSTCMAWWFQAEPGQLAQTRDRFCGRQPKRK